ncbi:MAG: hypothetical protein EXS18_06650 [Verrucomicrobiae bacterium]|nr:hypothetical protein [Verrucomicrobiae bacterium]
MSTKPKPVPLAIVICDQIIEDRLTGKKTLVGVFNSIAARNFPCTHGSMSVFVSLTDGRGKYDCVLVCRDESSEQPIMQTQGPIEFADPTVVVEMHFALQGVTFPKPGLYSFEFLADDELLLERKFNVTEIKANP